MARQAVESLPWDISKFENVHQIGGVRTALLESPGGSGQHSRVALVDTASGLRFTVALDRGGDIVDAFFNQHSLAYLTQVGLNPPAEAAHQGAGWLRNWPGGLVTTCGPLYIGGPRTENDEHVSLHGHFSNTPAGVEMLLNPDPQHGRTEILLSLVIRDARMFGPVLEVRRQIQCRLGEPAIILYDQVTNRSNKPAPHNWLYHVNLGYPLLDEGAQLIYRGKLHSTWNRPDGQWPDDQRLNVARIKRITAPIAEHVGGGERGAILDPVADKEGNVHVGLVNRKLGLGVELAYPIECLPRLANWQHFGPHGSYVTALEPFSGSLMGLATDDHPKARQWLNPGETRRYRMTLRVHHSRAALADLTRHDGPVQ